jgi:biotin carboxylase
LGIVGAFNMQCIEKGGEYYFIDINVRFPSGGLPLDVASGMNTPDIIIKLLNGENPKPTLLYGKTMLRYWDSLII